MYVEASSAMACSILIACTGGGNGFTGSSKCVSGYACHTYNEYYAQCIPTSMNTPGPTTAATSTSKPKPTTKPTVAPTKTKTSVSTPTHTSGGGGSSSKSAAYAGVNIAGFDFGCSTDGTCTVSGVVPPGATGNAQMKHFVQDDGLNTFRLPVGWQYLLNNQLGGNLDSANLANYNELVQGCLDAGAAMCIIDIHNYARWNGEIIGQGGPTNEQFASTWSQLASKYKSNSKIAFGVMNEPVSDLKTILSAAPTNAGS